MKRVQALVLVLAVFATSMASPVKAPAAMRKARQFVADKMGSRYTDKISLAYTSQNESAADDALFYVYNIGNDNGFVIIAGDDLATPVLGYTDRGSFSWDNMPDNLKIWLQYYKEAIAQVASRDVETAAPQARPSDVVEPLLSTWWDQTWPYNLLCPMSGNTQCPTGCVATAMAQVINYYQFPVEETNEIPSYYCSSLKKTMPALPPTTFEWDLMKNTYNRNSSEERWPNSCNTVGRLLRWNIPPLLQVPRPLTCQGGCHGFSNTPLPCTMSTTKVIALQNGIVCSSRN